MNPRSPDAARQGRQPPAMLVCFGLIGAAIGLYFVLVGAGLLPAPSGQHGPGWIVVCAGLVFLLSGVAMLSQAAGGADEAGELPPGAPRWIRIVQHFAALVVVGCMAMLGTWVALAGHADQFSASGPLVAVGAGVMGMRGLFGLGALITWLYVLALARRSVCLLIGQPKGSY